MSDFQTNSNYWWLSYILWNCCQMNVTAMMMKLNLDLVMAWYHQAANHYLSQRRVSSLSPYGQLVHNVLNHQLNPLHEQANKNLLLTFWRILPVFWSDHPVLNAINLVFKLNIPGEIGQDHGCWWPGSLSHQVISSHSIGYVVYMALVCYKQ